MGNIVYAKTRWPYSSYVDLENLFRHSGYPVVYVDEIDLGSDNLYITSPMNGDYRQWFDASRNRRRTCTIAHWLLERPDENGGMVNFTQSNQGLVDEGYVDFNIVSDPEMARHTGFKYIPMGSVMGLGIAEKNKKYDYIGLMSWTPRRDWLFQGGHPKPEVDGYWMSPNADPIEDYSGRDWLLSHTRIGLNVHKDDFHYCEPIRFALFAAYALPILTETIFPGTIYQEAVCAVDYRSIRSALKSVRENYDKWKEWGAWLHRRMCGPDSFRILLERHI